MRVAAADHASRFRRRAAASTCRRFRAPPTRACMRSTRRFAPGTPKFRASRCSTNWRPGSRWRQGTRGAGHDTAVCHRQLEPGQRDSRSNWARCEAQVSSGESQYHAWQTKVERRFSRSLGFLVSYTLAKSMDNGPAPFNLGRSHQQPQDPWVLNRSTRSRPQICAQPGRELHRGRACRSARGALLGGWQLNGIASLHSGLPVNVVRNGSTARL